MPKGIYFHKPWSDERKRQRSISLKGHIVLKKTRDKMSESQKGIPKAPRTHEYKWNEESKRKWSEKQKGMKRKKRTLEFRKRLSEIVKAKRPAIFTDESKLARKRFEYKIWRQAIYTRDDYICQKCRRHGGKLHPHHIVNFAKNYDRRYDANNGITLCVACHKLFHKKYGKKRNDIGQISEFIALKEGGFKLLAEGKK